MPGLQRDRASSVKRSAPLNRSGPLKRRTPLRSATQLARTGSPRAGKRRARIAPASAKTRDRDRYYRDLRRVWLPGRQCEYPDCWDPATDVHHRRGRGRLHMLNVATWSALCRPHHQTVTDHPDHGRQVGLIQSRHHQEIDLMPPPRAIPRCGSCGHAIAWAVTTAGKSIPIQAQPTGLATEYSDNRRAGRVQQVPEHDIDRDLFGDIPLALVGKTVVRALGEGEAPDPDLPIWFTHFVWCPNAEEWSR